MGGQRSRISAVSASRAIVTASSRFLLILGVFTTSVLSAQTDSTTAIPKMKLSGTLRAEGGIFNSSRNPGRMPSEYFTLSGNPRMKIGEWDVPVDFQIGNYANKLIQPFNKIGTSPSYKWITLHLGYRQLSYSPFTYNNHLLLGGGIELDPGKLRFTALYGELKRQSPGGFFDNKSRIATPSYKRMGVLTKVGVGSDDRFVDFIVIKVWDETPDSFMPADSMDLAPEENLVLGLHIEQLVAEKLRLKLSGALSAYTLDTRSSLTETDDYFAKEFVNSIFSQRISSQYLGAGMAHAEYREQLWQAEAEYSLIQPGFQSMGMYFNQSDLQKIGLGWRGQLLKKRLNASLNWRRENNNIMKTRSSENVRQYWNGNLKWNQKRSWYASLSGSYFSSNQKIEDENAFVGQGFEQATTQGMASFFKRRKSGGQHYSVQITAMQRVDKKENKRAYSNFTLRGTYVIELFGGETWNLIPELGWTRFVILEDLVTYRVNPRVKLAFRSKNKAWDGQVSTAPTFEYKDVGSNGLSWRTGMFASYRIKRKHRFQLRMDYNSRSGGYAYEEFLAKLSYQYSL